MKRFFLSIIVTLFMLTSVGAQEVALKTNILYDATATINIGVETDLARQWTLDVSGDYNPWTFSHNRKWKHWFVQPEARYWLCDKMHGSFLAGHLIGGQFNVGNVHTDFTFLGTPFSKLKNYRYQGWMAGAGVGYGYSWILSRHWNVEAELAVGYIYTRYDKYECATCGNKLGNEESHNYVGPTKAAVNLIYVF